MAFLEKNERQPDSDVDDGDDGNDHADTFDDGRSQGQDDPGGDSQSNAPASCDPSGTGEIMYSPGRTGDQAGAGQPPPDVSAEEQAWDEATHQALNLSKAPAKAPGAVEESIRDAHRSTLPLPLGAR